MKVIIKNLFHFWKKKIQFSNKRKFNFQKKKEGKFNVNYFIDFNSKC